MAPATTPTTPTTLPASAKLVGAAPWLVEVVEVEDDEPSVVASATRMPYEVEVSTAVEPPVVTVVVTTEVAVVEAVHADQVVQGALVDQEDAVQPEEYR